MARQELINQLGFVRREIVRDDVNFFAPRLVGHNVWFDLAFLNAAIERTGIKRSPFHPFTSFDTATLAGLAYGQTVLAKACAHADIAFDGNEAHSAVYDAERTADLFCGIVNRWQMLGGWPGLHDADQDNDPDSRE